MKRQHTKSQNFLRKPQLVKTLIGHSDLKKHDIVYDIGAGSGIIADALAEKVARVIAIEQDSRLVATLRSNLSGHNNLTVLKGDALSFVLPSDSYKVFANIPFHLSSPIVRRLTEAETLPDAIYLIVQKQFGQKLIIGEHNFTGQLGASIAPQFSTRIRYKLQRTDFWPHPAVDTVFIELLKRKQPLLSSIEMSSYREFIEQCFSRQKYFAIFNLGDKKPSELTAEEWVALYSRRNKTARP